MVGADAQGPAQLLAQLDQRREFLLEARQLGGILLGGVLLDGEFLGIGVVARIDPHHLDPFGGLERGLGLEVDVGDNRDVAAARAQVGHDVLEIGSVLDRRRGDADDLAAGLDEFEGLSHALGGVHGVARQHGLDDDRMMAADDDAAPPRFTHDHLAGGATPP